MKDRIIKVVLSKLMVSAVLGFLFIFAAPSKALAHARLTRSTPEASAKVTASPAQIDLWFNELLDGNFNSIAVYANSDTDAKTRANLATGEAKVDAADRTHLSISVKTLPPGEYVVEWRVLSLDGHTAPGKFKFSIVTAK